MDLDDTNLEIIIEPSSNLRHEKTSVGSASSVPQDESRGLNEMSPEDLDSLKRQVFQYALRDRWKEAEPIFNKYGEMVRIPLLGSHERALHVAAKANSISFVKGLVNLMTPQQLEIGDWIGYTAFHMAAKEGNRDIVQIMIEKNQNLPLIKSDWLPVHLAAIHGHHKIVQDLSFPSLLQKMDSEDIQQLFLKTIEHDMFDVATNLFEEYPDVLAIARYGNAWDWEEQTALEMLLRLPLKKLSTEWGNKRGSSLGESLLQKIWRHLEKKLGRTGIVELIGSRSSSLVDALESGNAKVLAWFLRVNFELLQLPINSDKHNILNYAVRKRHSSFLNFMFDTDYYHYDYTLKEREMTQRLLYSEQVLVDGDGNNILHLAAYPLQIEKTSSTLRPTTKMTIDVKWFKEIEKKAHPDLRKMRNNKGMMPKDIFHDEHKELSKQVKDTAKGIADSGMLVAALVLQ